MLPGGIAHDEDVIVIIYLRPFGNVGEKDQTDARSTRLVEFQSRGITAGNGGAGHDPGLGQRRSQEVLVAAVNDESVGEDLEDSATDEAAAFDAIRSDLLRAH